MQPAAGSHQFCLLPAGQLGSKAGEVTWSLNMPRSKQRTLKVYGLGLAVRRRAMSAGLMDGLRLWTLESRQSVEANGMAVR